MNHYLREPCTLMGLAAERQRTKTLNQARLCRGTAASARLGPPPSLLCRRPTLLLYRRAEVVAAALFGGDCASACCCLGFVSPCSLCEFTLDVSLHQTSACLVCWPHSTTLKITEKRQTRHSQQPDFRGTLWMVI